jgi:hypothetical protein
MCVEPVDISEMMGTERQRAMESLLFLSEKRDGRIKGRMVYNGKPTRRWLDKDDTTAPTVSLESLKDHCWEFKQYFSY